MSGAKRKPRNRVLVEYSSNNSGGAWWLGDEDWRALEAAGWSVEWKANVKGLFPYPDGRWLGALATRASKKFPSMDDALAEFMEITGEDPEAGGCNCCGQPHNFYETPLGAKVRSKAGGKS